MNGLELTFGEFLENQFGEVDKTNWMKEKQFGGIDRKTQLVDVLTKVLQEY